MKTILVTYTVKYELSIAPKYVWTDKNECYNIKSGRLIRQTIKNGMIGYCINSKFMSLKRIRPLLIKIKNQDCPF